jgi:hypothetical protein
MSCIGRMCGVPGKEKGRIVMRKKRESKEKHERV